MNQPVSWPQKTRELHSHHFDSTIWNDFRFRDDDIVIATCAKSGTTWMNGRWADQLTAGEKKEYEELAERNLGAQCARWLATGEGLE